MLINSLYNKKISFHFIMSLVFSFLLFSCSESKKENHTITIEWEGQRAKGMIIPLPLLSGISHDSIEQMVHIQLANNYTAILGGYSITKDVLIFRPLIAFTHGLKYELYIKGKLIQQIEIPAGMVAAPHIISVYPTNDTLPLNLLKFYIEFSKPMQEGRALENIIMIKDGHDTVSLVFLDLQQELWNKERTMLTLWLDPGRIKRDLQPNKKLGAPLEKNTTYQLVIKKDWTDAEGVSLSDTYRKDFSVSVRDSLSPDPERWTITLPKAGSSESLKIDLHESLDYVLLKNTLRIIDNNDHVLNGVYKVQAEETILSFIPAAVWNAGDYTIEIESRLEDLAGNNLNRLFDKDLTRQNKKEPKEIYKRSFRVK
jgi:hypothetical protein